MTPPHRRWAPRPALIVVLAAAVLLFAAAAEASTGDKSYFFKDCVRTCTENHCAPGMTPMEIPLHRRLLLWDCPSECDYLCQHTTTTRRIALGRSVVQFHGKWPFRRIFGMQEPFSVLFSLLNLAAHLHGLARLRSSIPPSYPLLRYYKLFACVSSVSWVFSAIFHSRDFPLTEELDYLGAGACVFYSMFYAPVRIFRLDRPDSVSRSRLRAWTAVCVMLYLAHVGYLKGVTWDYTYNMAANVLAGLGHNALWFWYCAKRYARTGEAWTLWPVACATWIMAAMSLELFDFPPVWGCFDAHSLWHLGTIVPAYLWYRFLVKDALEDLAGTKKMFSA